MSTSDALVLFGPLLVFVGVMACLFGVVHFGGIDLD
jgi:hypothetical protein